MAARGIRRPLHAGSWYSSDKAALGAEVDGLLASGATMELGARKVTALVGPHAGYSFCGEVLGNTYAHLPASTKRVVIIGPSHHVYMEDAALTQARAFSTPLGDVPVDVDAIDALMKTGLFSWFDPGQDEEEHSVEMHLPFVVRAAAMHKQPVPTIVPIIVGDVSSKQHLLMAKALAPLLADPGTILAVSTDFCHWGARFRFFGVDKAAAKRSGLAMGIQALDRQGMEAVSSLDPDTLRAYLDITGNTICGREALCIALEAVRAKQLQASAVVWPKYAQSSSVATARDSSVSYASGVFLADEPAQAAAGTGAESGTATGASAASRA